MIIEIPAPGSTATPGDAVATGSNEAPPPLAMINLNTATPEELELLPGIGEVTARRIVEFREENGPFRSIDDLIHVQGISDRTIDAFRDQVTVGP
jgi:competence protein ComEA